MINRSGFTLIELVLAIMTLVIALSAILGAYISQSTLNEHARNLSLAVQDANRIIEQVRQLNVGCGQTPSVVPPIQVSGPPIVRYQNWDAWLNETTLGTGGGPKSLQPVGATAEVIAVTCQSENALPTLPSYCPVTQMGSEWHTAGAAGTADPLRVTVAVCWRQKGRTIGECTWNGTVLTPVDGSNGPNDFASVIESPAMLTTLVTCR